MRVATAQVMQELMDPIIHKPVSHFPTVLHRTDHAGGLHVLQRSRRGGRLESGEFGELGDSSFRWAATMHRQEQLEPGRIAENFEQRRPFIAEVQQVIHGF